MKEGRKIYSLIVKDIDNDYYKIKIGDSYQQPLAVIDAYTSSFENEKTLYEGLAYLLQLEIVDAFIVYRKDEKNKSIKPIFKDMESLGTIAKKIGNSSEIMIEDRVAYARVHLFANKLIEAYYSDGSVYNTFNKFGDYIVLNALRESDSQYLINRLCEYRKLRKSMVLLEGTLNGKEVSVLPNIIELPEKIKKSDERLLEIVNKKIDQVQNHDYGNYPQAQIMQLDKLYNEKETLEAALGRNDDSIKGQMRLF